MVDTSTTLFDRLMLLTTVDNPEDVTEPVRMYVNTGRSRERPTVEYHSYEGGVAWEDTIGVFLDKSKI